MERVWVCTMKSVFKLSLVLLLISTSSLFSVNNKLVSFAKSAAIPGWGESSNKHYSAYIFFTTEATIWLSKFYYGKMSDDKFNKATTFAYQNAGIEESNQPEGYYDLLGKYRSSGYDVGGYNADVVAKSRELNLTPEEQTAYINANVLGDDVYWYWNSSDNQKQYKILRKDGFSYKDKAKVVGGLVILNHLISGINAARIAGKSKPLPVTFNFDLNRQNQKILNCSYKF